MGNVEDVLHRRNRSATTTEVSQCPHEPSKGRELVALFSFDSSSPGDLVIKKNDILILIAEKNSDWLFVKNRKGQKGYVPKAFVALRESDNCESWYAGPISRQKANRLILSSLLPRGAFLVRQREENPNEFALTVRDINESNEPVAKHYLIKRDTTTEEFFIVDSNKFHSLRELIRFYRSNPSALRCKLTIPAPRDEPMRPGLSYDIEKNWEIPKTQIKLKMKLDDGCFGDVWYGKWRGVCEVAVKMMKPGSMDVKDFLASVSLMRDASKNETLLSLFSSLSLGRSNFFCVSHVS
ncbi:hypothetical protein AB6A40_005583 [Gnathostoma spinigerum]|uniref:Tyrosine-protein kinase n=1 Tax=Gnathostoma spinigerum TaxID=75299 RepID=A0ABD6ENH4_9BILA